MDKLPWCWMITVQSILTRHGVFWRFSLARNNNSKKKQIIIINPTHYKIWTETGGIHSYIFFSRSMSLKESTVQSRGSERGGGGGEPSVDGLRQLRPFEDDGSAIGGVPTRRLEQTVMISGLWKDDRFAGNVRWNTFSFRNPGSVQTLNFSFLSLKNKKQNKQQKQMFPGTQPAPRRSLQLSCKWLRIQCTASAI